MSYTWLLFDADGTIFDFDAAEEQALEWTFQQMGFDYLPEYGRLYREINAAIWNDLEQGRIQPGAINGLRFERLLATIGMTPRPDLHAFGERYLGNLARGTQLIDGAQEVVEAIHGRYRLAIITNGLKEVQRLRLARSTVGRFFQPVIISQEVGASKPDPRIFDAAFAKMGAPARSEVLIIGDSLSSDIAGGSAYGIDTCWFNPAGKSRPNDIQITYEIGDLRELLDLV